ncbi:MAG: hypothetical protein ABI693_30510 [Bryobacteraceae bacterium]
MPRAFTAFLYLLAATSPLAAQSQVTVTNAATFLDRFGVAPGGLASLFGDFSGFSTTVASGLPWLTELGRLQVLVNGVPSPIYAVVPASASNSGQINFQVPAGAPGGIVQVKLNGQLVGQGTMTVNAVSPGIFLLDYNTLQGAILNQDFSVNSISSRAKRGDVIQIYGTGQGALQTSVVDGAAPSTYALSGVTPKVYIGDVETTVQFSGVVGYPGLWQINAVVPDRLFINGPTPLVVVMNGVQSNQSTFWVVE